MLQQNASGYNIPIFFSETGCNTPEPRTFDDQSAILGSEMDGTWSGAIIYEWIEEVNNYGLISYGPTQAPTAMASNVINGFVVGGTPTPISPDFENLSSQWATLNPTGVSANAYTTTETPPPCPAYTSGLWEISGDVPLPTLNEDANTYTTALASTTTKGGSKATTGTATDPTGTASSGTASGSASSSTASSAASPSRAQSLGLRRRSTLLDFEGTLGPWVLLGMLAVVLGVTTMVM